MLTGELSNTNQISVLIGPATSHAIDRMIAKLPRHLAFPSCHEDMNGYHREELFKNRQESEVIMAAFDKRNHPAGFCHVTFESKQLPCIRMLAVALPENRLLTQNEFESIALKLLNRVFLGYLDRWDRVVVPDRSGLVGTVTGRLSPERQRKLNWLDLSRESFQLKSGQ